MEYNGLTLAYLGDAVYEVYIRKHLISGNYKVKDLQQKAINYVSARGQSNYLDKMLDDNFLTEKEIDIVKRAMDMQLTVSIYLNISLLSCDCFLCHI